MLAITPLVIPLLVGFRGATGLLARVDAVLARSLLGVDVEPPISSGGRWFWGKGKAVLVDASFWRQQVYLAIRMVGGFAVAVGIVALIGGALQAIAYPITYRWSTADIGSWHADTLGRALLFLAGRHRRAVRRRAPDRAARAALAAARRGPARAAPRPRARPGRSRARRAARRSPSTPASRPRSS